MFNTTFVKDDDLSSQDNTSSVLRDTTNNTTATTVSSQEEEQPRKFRKSGDASREAMRGSENTSTSDISLEGIAKPARKRKLGKKTSQFFNPV